MEASLKFHYHGCLHAATFLPSTKPISISHYPRFSNSFVCLRSESPLLLHSDSANCKTLKSPPQNLKNKAKSSDSLQLLLEEDGDLSEDQFWAAVDFLKQDSRSDEIVQVFTAWKKLNSSRLTQINYNKLISSFCEDGCMEAALSALYEMKNSPVEVSLEAYTSIVHGFSDRGDFERALFFLNEMKESGLRPDSYIYGGLIKSYGKFGRYDEMNWCIKEMETDECPPDHVTYNILIREFARAALFNRMESIFRRLHSKRMYLQPSSLLSMLEAYTKFGILDKMDKLYTRIVKSKIPLKEDLIRRMAFVYIENRMFSRLEDMGLDHYSTNLGWCLRLLARGCLMSKKGMKFVLKEMEEQGVPLNVTFANIVSLSCLKMRDFKYLRAFLSEIGNCESVRPDLVTVGVVMDAVQVGFCGGETVELWRRFGVLDRHVGMNTDPLVLAAFGKGEFLRSFEEVYSEMEPEIREGNKWTYNTLIHLIDQKKIK